VILLRTRIEIENDWKEILLCCKGSSSSRGRKERRMRADPPDLKPSEGYGLNGEPGLLGENWTRALLESAFLFLFLPFSGR
jgi:hypothetical protein